MSANTNVDIATDASPVPDVGYPPLPFSNTPHAANGLHSALVRPIIFDDVIQFDAVSSRALIVSFVAFASTASKIAAVHQFGMSGGMEFIVIPVLLQWQASLRHHG